MHKLLSRSLEILAARITPGVVNVYGIILLAGWMPAGEYGIFSTLLATAGLLANIFYGPIKLGILPKHADFDRSGNGREFEGSVIGATIAISMAIASAGLLLQTFGLTTLWFLVLLISLGIQATLQPILQARIQFWRYGISSILQAISLIASLWFSVRSEPSVSQALAAYTISTSVGFISTYLLMGAPRPRLPNSETLKSTLSVGFPFTLSTLAESSLLLGFRYAIIFFGTPTILGTFSLAVDLAQRLIGVVISITSFAITPLAYRADASGNRAEFKRILLSGTFFSLALAVASTTAVLVAAWTGLFPALQSESFSYFSFSIISLSVILNRIRKIAIDPIAVRHGMASTIPVGYACAGPAMVALGCIALSTKAELLIYPIYLSGYALAAALTIALANKKSEQKIFL